MILEIEPPHGHTLGPLNYNETKAKTVKESDPKLTTTMENPEDIKTKGYVVATRNVPEGSSLEDEFERLKILGLINATRKKITLESFHMSVNPSATDKALTDEEARAFIDEVMQRLGYGNSPYRIYRHQDIAREHFHVVSTRIGQDGKKIKDSFEKYQIHSILKELAPKYGFSVEETHMDRVDRAIKAKAESKDRKEPRTERKPSPRKREKREYVPAFSRESEEPVTEQITNAHEDAMQWHFSTFEQYRLLMRDRYSIDVEYLEDTPDYPSGALIYSGLKDRETRVTPALSNNYLGIDLDRIMEKCGGERMSEKKAQRNRLEKAVKESMETASSYPELHKELKKRGVAMSVSWSKDGKPFGVTYFDYATRCIWKGSETATTFQWLKDSCGARGFEILQAKSEKPVRQKKSQQERPSLPPAVVGQPRIEAEKSASVQKGTGKAPAIPRFHPANAGSGPVGVDDVSGKKDEDEIMEEIRLGLR